MYVLLKWLALTLKVRAMHAILREICPFKISTPKRWCHGRRHSLNPVLKEEKSVNFQSKWTVRSFNLYLIRSYLSILGGPVARDGVEVVVWRPKWMVAFPSKMIEEPEAGRTLIRSENLILKPYFLSLNHDWIILADRANVSELINSETWLK